MKSAIIIVNWNGFKDTIECLESIFTQECLNHKIFVLDNGSTNESVKEIEKVLSKSSNRKTKLLEETTFLAINNFNDYENYLISHSVNLGFSKGNNFIIDHIYQEFDYITMLNNDTVVTKNAISKMIECMEQNKSIGVLSCNIRLYSNKDKLWNAGGIFKWYGDRKYFRQSFIDEQIFKENYLIATPFVTGCVMMIRKEIIESYGSLTEQFFFGEEDFNFCYKLKRNKVEVKTLLSSTIYHKVNASISEASKGEKMYIRKSILHFTNRIINLRNFYSPFYWKIWTYFYLFAVTINISIKNKSLRDGRIVRKFVRYYVNNYNEVDYNLFIEINNLKF